MTEFDADTIFKLLVQKQIDGLTAEVQSIKSIILSTVDVNGLRARKLKLFHGQDEMRRVFLRCDGLNTNSDIARHEEMKMPNVARAISKLSRFLLVYETKNLTGRRVFARIPVLEQIGLLESLEQQNE